MNAKNESMMGMKVKLSTAWIFVMFNMAFADILSFMYPGFLKEIMAGNAGGVQVTPEFLLIAAICLEIPIVMICVSRMMKYRANRWANIIAGIITIVFVIRGGSTFPHYIFFATLEVLCLAFIIWNAWRWPRSESLS